MRMQRKLTAVALCVATLAMAEIGVRAWDGTKSAIRTSAEPGGAGDTQAPSKLRIPTHEKIVLKNGLTVLLLEKHTVPMVNIAVIVKAGPVSDLPGQEGLASITAGLLRKGTKTRSAQQFAADIDFIGGTFEADSRADYTIISAEFLTKDLREGLDLVADAMLHPTFPQTEVDKLLTQAIDGVKASKDSVQEVLFPYYESYLYNGSGYGRPANGDELSLKNIHRDAIAKFYETYYTPGNTILAVAGDFSGTEVKKQVEETLGVWPGKTSPSIKVDGSGPMKGKRLLLVDKPDATQTFFAIGNLGTTATDPDRVAIRVVNTIFGSRFTSMLNEALRVESGLTYGASSYFIARQERGPFAVLSYTKNETTTQAIDMALEVLRKLHADGVTPEQLASAKSYIKGQVPPTIETSEQLASLIAANEFYGLGDGEVNELEARVDAVTPEVAKRVISKHFPLDDLTFVLIGKASEISGAVKKYAEKQDAKEISAPGYWSGTQSRGKEIRRHDLGWHLF